MSTILPGLDRTGPSGPLHPLLTLAGRLLSRRLPAGMPDGHTWLWPMMAARSLLAEPGARPALLDGTGRAWAALAAGTRWRGEAVMGTTLRHHPSGAEHAWFLRWPR